MRSSIVTSYTSRSSASTLASSSATMLLGSSGTTLYNKSKSTSEIPTGSENPFLQSTRFRQGTLYEIIFPIIGGFLFLYVLGVAINKYKASKQAKVVEPFDRDYEFADYTTNLNNEKDIDGDDDLDNPFSNRYESSNKSFTHKKNLSSVDFISQYRRSMDHLSGMTLSPQNNNYSEDGFTTLGHNANHSKSQSIGSVLQLNFSQQPQLVPQSQNNSSDPDNSVFYSMVGTDSQASQDDINKIGADSRGNNTDKASFHSIVEPTKAAKNATVNIPNHKSHFHHRKLSSLVLDEFISTGELPALSDQPRTLNDISNENGTTGVNPIMQNPRNNASVESHSMFEDNSFNNSYDIPDSDFAVKHSVARSPSPRRNNRVGMYRQNPSRSPTRSPVRNTAQSPNKGGFTNV